MCIAKQRERINSNQILLNYTDQQVINIVGCTPGPRAKFALYDRLVGDLEGREGQEMGMEEVNMLQVLQMEKKKWERIGRGG